MVGYLLRLLRVALAAPFRPRLDPGGESRLELRVWPDDLDVNLHMNNGRYLTAMDFGRFDLMLRMGLMKDVLRLRLKPVLASSLVRYRRSLAPFQSYVLRSRIVGWDEKWLFIEHVIESKGEIFCQAAVKGLFLGPKGALPTPDLLALAGAAGQKPLLPPLLPQWIADWQAAEAGARG
jgi:acyl-CoA thioesterase FadM